MVVVYHMKSCSLLTGVWYLTMRPNAVLGMALSGANGMDG